jgi:alpha-tubulin suppressor-like RCC1 family protein
VLQVTAGGSHSCAVLTGGVVKCWGENFAYQLGLGNTKTYGWTPDQMGNELPAVDLGTGKTALSVSAGYEHTCAVLSDGHVKCWGSNAKGQLGLGDDKRRGGVKAETGDALPVVDLGTGKTAVSVSAGHEHTCALLNDASVKCWGANVGQLGQGDDDARGDDDNEMGDYLLAVDLGEGKTALDVVTGVNHTCALLDDYSVKCWGTNGSYQLGLGDNISRGDDPGEMGDNLPAVSLGTGKTARAISARAHFTCALLNDNSVKCWGYNGNGQLGLGDVLLHGDGQDSMGDALPAVSLGTGKIPTKISAGYAHTCVLFIDGDVKCWGLNVFGELGLGDSLNRGDEDGEMGDMLLAVSLGTEKTAVAITAGFVHACAILNDASVKCWGYNFNAQLGLGAFGHRGDKPNEMGDNLPAVKLFSELW